MSSAPAITPGLSQIAGRQVLFCDVWGVVHNGVAPFASACDALQRFRAEGGTVILVTNAPRPNATIQRQLELLGVPGDAWDVIVTSGDVSRGTIAERAGQKLHFIGPERDLALFKGLDAPFATLEEATYCVCTGLFDDENETVADYEPALQAMAARGLMMLCANPDLVVDRGDKLVLCAGSLALAYERMGGQVRYSGKPWQPIYELAHASAARMRGHVVERSHILGVGDAIRTDIAGARRYGIDALMVLAGIHAGEVLDAKGQVDTARLPQWLDSQDIRPDYLMPVLHW